MEKAKAILTKIKQEKITMESPLVLNWKNYFYWFLLVLSVFLGALFFSFLILNFLDFDLKSFSFLGLQGIFFFFFNTGFYFWLFFIGLFLFLGFFLIRQTKKGYRYDALLLFCLALLSIVILGLIFHQIKVDNVLKNRMLERMPRFKEERLFNPEAGFLIGEIVKIEDSFLEIKDPQGKNWQIILDFKTMIRPKKEFLKNNSMIRIVGVKVAKDKFKANLIKILPEKRN